MRLSDAIRLGAMLKPQAVGTTKGDGGQSCALQAACESVGVASIWDIQACYAAFPVLMDWAQCPECRDTFMLDATVIHLNDEHHWTRERIADWVQTLEAPAPALSSEAATPRSVAIDPSADVLERVATRANV